MAAYVGQQTRRRMKMNSFPWLTPASSEIWFNSAWRFQENVNSSRFGKLGQWLDFMLFVNTVCVTNMIHQPPVVSEKKMTSSVSVPHPPPTVSMQTEVIWSFHIKDNHLNEFKRPIVPKFLPSFPALRFWRRLLHGLYHIWSWRPFWSMTRNRLNKLPLPWH